jgi:anti-anti-sigma regulatory factor
MLRISQDEKTDGSVSVRLEGVLSGPWVDEMGRVCGVIVSNGQSLRIDLAEVIFVDRAGIDLLANLRKRNAVLDHCSPFLSVQLGATLA